MSGKGHRHSRERGARDGERHGKQQGGHARDGPRDGRDRDERPRQDGGRAGQASTTPPKPRPPSAGAARGGPVLGASVFSSAILEAAKRRAQEAASAEELEEGEAPAGGARKRAKHEPIVWQSPRRGGGGDGGGGGGGPPGETLQERLQREAAEFKQRQQELAGGGAAPGSGRGRAQHGRGRSPSSSEGSPGGGGGGGGRRRSSSRSSSSEGRPRKPAGGRWQAEEEEDGAADAPKAAPRSRWAVDDDDEGEAAGLEEGEAPPPGSAGAAIDEELEALNRRERAELEAGGLASASESPGGGGGEALSEDEGPGGGAPFNKSMLEESRRVEEYERLNRISEGTYGVVHRARCKASGTIYALKKLKLEACPDGFPQTSVREMNVLLALHHENIVNVSEVVVGARDAVYMVMEFVEHDLKYVLELQAAKKAPPFSIGQVKCLMQQLLAGIAYLHDQWVIHRDLKTSNLLYSNTGQLKICDFGLARQYGSPLRAYTPAVVTLWYRSIERLLGEPLYSTALDMWSVGCIMGELIAGEPLFQGRGELDQIKKVFALLGTPRADDWPGWDQLPDARNLTWKPQESTLRRRFPPAFFGSQPLLNETGFDLLNRLLALNPAKRISARDALAHPWFSEAPRPVAPALMPSFPSRNAGG
ncbi:CDKG-2 [Scenedesmus sp. PABB004]|nr:CDKG-2 [Scenedesmus sp. PABB004]